MHAWMWSTIFHTKDTDFTEVQYSIIILQFMNISLCSVAELGYEFFFFEELILFTLILQWKTTKLKNILENL